MRLAERVRFILWSSEGLTCAEQGRRMGVDAQRVRRWRKRWAGAASKLGEVARSKAPESDLEALICDVLSDDERSGGPAKFTAEQLTQIVALACKEPQELGLPVSHWVPNDLAREAIKAGIVDSISPRHIARFFEGGVAEASPLALLAEPEDRRPVGTLTPSRRGLRPVP